MLKSVNVVISVLKLGKYQLLSLMINVALWGGAQFNFLSSGGQSALPAAGMVSAHKL